MAVQAPRAQANGARAPAKKDDRIHSVVYHKLDPRVTNIIRQHKKSDIINLYDIDCCMLFRVEQAHMQFDMFQNYRPYILFQGQADGVFLPKKMGLLFPNACDQLDFRTDRAVPVEMTYALSDTEIAVMAGNGLFNNGWSCQGRVIGSVLEIPCKVDYAAIARTPLTFIEIQNRMAFHTSTMQTGYKTLVSAFLPYAAQKHNVEHQAAIVEGPSFHMGESEIRRRTAYEPKPVGFGAESGSEVVAKGADFVASAQSRIKQKLAREMAKSDVLGIRETVAARHDGAAVADNIAKSVAAVREKTNAERERALKEAEQAGIKVRVSDIDAKLNDMASRMVLAGASQIPIEQAKLKAETILPDQPSELPPEVMTDPIRSAEMVRDKDDKIHHAVADAEQTAGSISGDLKQAKSKTRQQLLAERRARKAKIAENVGKAMEEAGKIMPGDGKSQDTGPAPDSKTAGPRVSRTASASKQGTSADGDILAGNVDIDEILKQF